MNHCFKSTIISNAPKIAKKWNNLEAHMSLCENPILMNKRTLKDQFHLEWCHIEQLMT